MWNDAEDLLKQCFGLNGIHTEEAPLTIESVIQMTEQYSTSRKRGLTPLFFALLNLSTTIKQFVQNFKTELESFITNQIPPP